MAVIVRAFSAVLVDFGTAAQKRGRNLDVFLSSVPIPVRETNATNPAGTDHVWIRMFLCPVNANTLCARLELPTQKPTEVVDKPHRDGWEQELTIAKGAPPSDWDQWIVEQRKRVCWRLSGLNGVAPGMHVVRIVVVYLSETILNRTRPPCACTSKTQPHRQASECWIQGSLEPVVQSRLREGRKSAMRGSHMSGPPRWRSCLSRPMQYRAVRPKG